MMNDLQECRTYSAKELSAVLGISLTAAYELMHNIDFPSVRIGGRYKVLRDDLDTWLVMKKREKRKSGMTVIRSSAGKGGR